MIWLCWVYGIERGGNFANGRQAISDGLLRKHTSQTGGLSFNCLSSMIMSEIRACGFPGTT